MTLQRREFLAATAMAAVLGAPARAADLGLSFGLTPVFLTNDQELLTLIRGYLEEALGARVQLVQRRTYQEITAMLLAGQIDAAWICGYPYVRHRDDFALLNPVENVWQYLRANWLAISVFDDYDAIVDACCRAWNRFADDPDVVSSITASLWANVNA
jgi:ABC-type nitrate/sulfonate/bicarbonate transport system substrate-binding protein